MGRPKYYYKPTEETMEKYKPWKFDDKFYEDDTSEIVRDMELELLIYCLEDHSNDSTSSILKHLKFTLKLLNACIESHLKASLYKEWKTDSEICIYGIDNYYEDADDVIDRNVDSLLILCKVVKTDDYFGGIESHFYDKWNDIKDKIEYISDSFRDCFNHSVKQELSEFYQDPYKDLKEELQIKKENDN